MGFAYPSHTLTYCISLGEKTSFCFSRSRPGRSPRGECHQVPHTALYPKCRFDVNLCPLCPLSRRARFPICGRVKLLPVFLQKRFPSGAQVLIICSLQTNAHLASVRFAAAPAPICFRNRDFFLMERPWHKVSSVLFIKFIGVVLVNEVT